jgi:hypothetical protein
MSMSAKNGWSSALGVQRDVIVFVIDLHEGD